jgi:hypothetical protein
MAVKIRSCLGTDINIVAVLNRCSWDYNLGDVIPTLAIFIIGSPTVIQI